MFLEPELQWGTPFLGLEWTRDLAWPHLCNGKLLLGHVARHVDHLHPVPQWLRDGLGDVGRADEQHLEDAVVRC